MFMKEVNTMQGYFCIEIIDEGFLRFLSDDGRSLNPNLYIYPAEE